MDIFAQIYYRNLHDSLLEVSFRFHLKILWKIKQVKSEKIYAVIPKSLKEKVVTFEKQSNFLVSRIKINFHDKQKVIIEVVTTKEILTSTLENILYIFINSMIM